METHAPLRQSEGTPPLFVEEDPLSHTPPRRPRFANTDLSGCSSISIDLKGDGTRYTLTLASGEMSMMGGQPSVMYDVYPPAEWTTLTIPMADFAEQQGFGMWNSAPFDAGEANSIGLSHSAFLPGTLSKDPKFVSGPFDITLRNLRCNK